MKSCNVKTLCCAVLGLAACGGGAATNLPASLKASMTTSRTGNGTAENFRWAVARDGGTTTVTESLVDTTSVPAASANARTLVFTSPKEGGFFLAGQTTLVSKEACGGNWADVTIRSGSISVVDIATNQFAGEFNGEVSCDGGTPSDVVRRGTLHP